MEELPPGALAQISPPRVPRRWQKLLVAVIPGRQPAAEWRRSRCCPASAAARAPTGGRPNFYFFLLGMAFMMVGVVLIQQYALLIGPSVYSLVTVLAVLLVGSGLGSRLSPRAGDALPSWASPSGCCWTCCCSRGWPSCAAAGDWARGRRRPRC
ncbi:MAG: hypothetical protein IPH09_02700 [bacterium]|nr:hypothetical protein [bacterium]